MMEEEEEENQQPKENEEGGEGKFYLVGVFLCLVFAVDSGVHVGKPDDKKEKGGDKADDKVR